MRAEFLKAGGDVQDVDSAIHDALLERRRHLRKLAVWDFLYCAGFLLGTFLSVLLAIYTINSRRTVITSKGEAFPFIAILVCGVGAIHFGFKGVRRLRQASHTR